MNRGTRALGKPTRSTSLTTAKSELLALAPDALGRLPTLDGPLDVLVTDGVMRTRTKSLRTHLWSGPILPGSFFPLGEGVFCTTPEFLVVQRAQSLSLVELIGLVMTLCAIYSFDESHSIRLCDPLTNLERIAAFIGRMPACPGTAKAKLAVRYALERSASPWETRMALLNTLKPAMGGYHFEKPKLNHPIQLGKQAQRMTHRRHYVCDEYWPQYKIDLEFNGAQFHDDPDQAREDARRKKVLEFMGIRVIDVRAYELASLGIYDDVARQLAHYMGKRLRVFDAKHRHARIELRKALFADSGGHFERRG